MSKAKIKALETALKTGSAIDPNISQKNGANLRMIKRMIAAGLLHDQASYTITSKGIQMLRENGHRVINAPANNSGPFRIRSVGMENGKPWSRFHGEPITGRDLAEQCLTDLNARTARVYGNQPAPFVFELGR